MSKVKLNDAQIKLRKTIEEKLKKLKLSINNSNHKLDYDEISIIYKEMAVASHELHMSLDPQPKHHRYMIENRGMSPDNIEFYEHIHPVEDLLKYLDDTSANDDPEDKTIGCEFYMNIYSRRYEHEDKYTIIRTEEGWEIVELMGYIKSDKGGKPGLYNLLDHDSINYPEELPGYMEYLWDIAKEKGLDYDSVQLELSNLAEWINICEKSSPAGIFGGYK